MFSKIIDFFKKEGWSYVPVENETAVILGIKGENGNFECLAEVNEVNNSFIFFSIFNENIPEGKRSEVSELLTRLNYGKFQGNFEMDFEDGELRYKTSIYYGSQGLNLDVIENMVLTNIATMDRSISGFMRLIYGNINPLDAYLQIEEDTK